MSKGMSDETVMIAAQQGAIAWPNEKSILLQETGVEKEKKSGKKTAVPRTLLFQ